MSTDRRGHIKKRTLDTRGRDGKVRNRWDITVYAGKDPATGKKIYRRKRGFLSLADAEQGLAEIVP